MTETEFRKQVSHTLKLISNSFEKISVSLMVLALIVTSAWSCFIISGLNK